MTSRSSNTSNVMDRHIEEYLARDQNVRYLLNPREGDRSATLIHRSESEVCGTQKEDERSHFELCEKRSTCLPHQNELTLVHNYIKLEETKVDNPDNRKPVTNEIYYSQLESSSLLCEPMETDGPPISREFTDSPKDLVILDEIKSEKDMSVDLNKESTAGCLSNVSGAVARQLEYQKQTVFSKEKEKCAEESFQGQGYGNHLDDCTSGHSQAESEYLASPILQDQLQGQKLVKCYVKLERLQECDICKLILTSYSELKEHLKCGHDRRKLRTKFKSEYKCQICFKTFKYKKSFQDHNTEEHGNTTQENSKIDHLSRNFKCKICYMLFENHTALASHKRKKHIKWKETQCRKCEKILDTLDLLSEHKAEDTCCKCPECPENFSHKSEVRPHVKLAHRTGKTHQCPHCPAIYRFPIQLRTHLRTHTGERPHVCPICHYAFNVRGTMQKHMKSHNKEKEYNCVCEVCGSRFVDRSVLERHSRVHTGEKPFKCHICSSAHSTQSALKIHIRTHTGEKPYMCSECGQGYIAYSCLKIHMQSHHGMSLKIDKYEVKVYK